LSDSVGVCCCVVGFVSLSHVVIVICCSRVYIVLGDEGCCPCDCVGLPCSYSW
jgi:hypothetical protein